MSVLTSDLDKRLNGLKAPHSAPGADKLESAALHYDLDKEELLYVLDCLISPKLNSLCKQYCFNNRYQYKCTLDREWGLNHSGTHLCEWGNASYSWFLEELTHVNRLEKIKGEDRTVIVKYFNKIIHSIPFLERFKNWRFQRRIRVPEYIKAIDVDAHKVFWAMCDNDTVQNIAQRIVRSEEDTKAIATKINQELVKRKRSQLLNLTELTSLSSLQKDDGSYTDADIPVEDLTLEQRELQVNVRHAYNKLDWLEQFIIDSMIIDGLTAKSVLASLVKQNITVDERVEPEDLNIQHVYYFFRKTLAKLKQNTGI